MKARLLLLTILTSICTVGFSQNTGRSASADSIIIIRHDTLYVLRCDTMINTVLDTLSVEQLTNVQIRKNTGKALVASKDAVRMVNEKNMPVANSAQPTAAAGFATIPAQVPSQKATPTLPIPTPGEMPQRASLGNQPSYASLSPEQHVSGKMDDDELPEAIVDEKGRRTTQRIDRSIQTRTFVPKGTWFGGATISYSEQEFDNLNYLLIKDINAKGYTFGMSPFVGYFVKKDLAVGARFTYNRSMLDIGNLDLNLGEDFKINLKDMYYLEHDYQVAGFMRTYMSLFGSKVMGFFSEMRLAYGHSQAKMLNGRYENGTLDGTFSESNYMHIGFAPGLTAFVQNWMSVEVQMGVMGFNFKWTDQVTNQVEHGKQRNMSGKFDIDLFSISIGTTLYF